MPCTKCKEGKYKWGKTGECEYATKEDCESANHKYNNMRPTPLGKKSYEEYEKELKEFNLSSELKRFDFKDAKTLKKQINEVKSITKEISGAIKNMNSEGKASNSLEKQFDALEKERDAINKKEDKIGGSWEKAYQKYDKANDKVGTLRGDLFQLEQSLEKNISAITASLKELGVDSPPIVEQAKAAISKLQQAWKKSSDSLSTKVQNPTGGF